jgi:hypothetical protein
MWNSFSFLSHVFTVTELKISFDTSMIKFVSVGGNFLELLDGLYFVAFQETDCDWLTCEQK